MREQSIDDGAMRTLTFWGYAEAEWNMKEMRNDQRQFLEFQNDLVTHQLHKHLLRTYHVLEIALGAQYQTVNKMGPNPCFMEI